MTPLDYSGLVRTIPGGREWPTNIVEFAGILGLNLDYPQLYLPPPTLSILLQENN
jgi:hypothetical protein